MSARTYTETDLVQWLEVTGTTPRPDYVDDLLARTARSRQRPAWRSPERWLPMDLTVRAPALSGRRVPVRSLAVAALILLAIGVAATVYLGSQRRVPPPFGPAQNGLIVYAAPTDPAWTNSTDYVVPQGDIMTVDPVTGHTSVLVGGPTVDGFPVVSHDGTRVAFVRADGLGQRLYVVDLAGGEPRPLTTEPISEIIDVAWSPNGGSVAFIAADGDRSSLWIARSDGTEAHAVDLGAELSFALPQWRPPDGNELLLVGAPSSAEVLLPQEGYRDLYGSFEDPTVQGTALYLVRPDGSDLRRITPADGAAYDYGRVSWTPTGNQILTHIADPTHGDLLRIQVLAADGSPVRTIEPTTGVEAVGPVVSPDGQRVAYADFETRSKQWTLRIEPLDGSGDPVQIGDTFDGQAAVIRWSPDGTQLIVTHQYYKETWLFDVDGGPGRRATWTDPGSNAWQRLAR